MDPTILVFVKQIVHAVLNKTEKTNIHRHGCDSEMAVFNAAAPRSLKIADLSTLYWLTTELYKVSVNSSLP
jgi:hypothetical protein